jgi:hypothetical protein
LATLNALKQNDNPSKINKDLGVKISEHQKINPSGFKSQNKFFDIK